MFLGIATIEIDRQYQNVYSSDRPFQWAIVCLKRISYVEFMTLGSWCTNLPQRGPHDFWHFIS